MSDYSPNEFLAFFFKDRTRSEAHLTRVAELLSQHTSYRVWERWLSPGRRVGILNISTWPLTPAVATGDEPARGAPSLQSNRLRVRARMTVLQTGYTTTPHAAWEASLRQEGDALTAADAGGIAAFCLATFGASDDERLFLWSTRPGLRLIASSDSPQAWIAGTRPRLVHMVARDFQAVRLDRGYVLSSLAGWSLDETTPYEETSLLPVDALLQVRGDAVPTLHSHPTPSYQRSTSSWLMAETRRYRKALREAVGPLRQVSGFEFRLSGGKDSRLLAAALHDSGIVPSSPVCHGIEGEWETPVAKRVASALGWPLKCVVPEFNFKDDLIASVRHNLSLSDGFFASEPLQVAYPQYGMSGDRGPGLVLGHIELQRGGWAESMKGGPKAMRRALYLHLTPRRHSVLPEFSAQVERLLAAYIAAQQPISPVETGYRVNYRYRVCRWLGSQLFLHGRALLPIYPLLDEKVVRVVSNAPLQHLVTESLAFSTMCSMAPELRPIGLFKDRFRFEEKKRRLRFMRGYEARTPIDPSPSTYWKRELLQPGAVMQVLCDHIRQGKLREELRAATREGVWAAIEDPSPERVAATGVPRKKLSSHIWACFQASVLFTEGLSD
jgi:hypothetical protein